MRSLAIGVTVTVLAVSPAGAQIGNPAGMTAATPQSEPGKPAPHQPNAQDRLFTSSPALAAWRKSRPRSWPRRRPAMRWSCRRSAARHKTQLAELERLSGVAFDLAYMRQQLVETRRPRISSNGRSAPGRMGSSSGMRWRGLPNVPGVPREGPNDHREAQRCRSAGASRDRWASGLRRIRLKTTSVFFRPVAEPYSVVLAGGGEGGSGREQLLFGP